jgi:hypothetical protein
VKILSIDRPDFVIGVDRIVREEEEVPAADTRPGEAAAQPDEEDAPSGEEDTRSDETDTPPDGEGTLFS